MNKIRFKDGTTLDVIQVMDAPNGAVTIILNNNDYVAVRDIFTNVERISCFDTMQDDIIIGTYNGFKELQSIQVSPTIDFAGNPIDNFIVNIREVSMENKVNILEEKYNEIDQTINPIIDMDKMSLDELIKYKVSEFGKQCTQNIYAGADVELSTGLQHFSFTDQDQVNIKAGFDIAYNTGLSVPYHADKEYCTIYKASDMLKIYGTEQTLITRETTYCNMLNNYVRGLTDKEAAKVTNYGDELTEELNTKMSEILSHAQTILETLLQNAAPDIVFPVS